jgi:SAM-dependent methyltransferase
MRERNATNTTTTNATTTNTTTTNTAAADITAAERGQVTGAAAEIYEAFFVPALFGQFTESVLDHAEVGTDHRVLDVGCGTGVLARAAARRVGPDGAVAGVDPNPGMLAVARRTEPSIDWRAGTAESLPFADQSFDHVVSQFAAMFFTDRPRALDEMARVCVDGGTVTIATWSDLGRTPGYDAMVGLIADELGDEAADALRAPFLLGNPEHVKRLLEPIGVGARVDEVAGTARFASIADWVHTDVRGWTLAALVDDAAETTLIERAGRDLAGFVTADGSVAFPAPALLGTVVVR